MLNRNVYRSNFFPFRPCYAVSLPSLLPTSHYFGDDLMGKFLKQSPEQLEQLRALKRYSKKLLFFRAEFARTGRRASFAMYEILSIEIISPIDGTLIRALLKEYNSTDILLYSPLLPYTILFEDCPTGFVLIQRLRAGKFLK
jgi:hypothetical protein